MTGAGDHAAELAVLCDYHERDRACREPGIYEVQMDGKRLHLCKRHVRPEYHPPDLHKKLPGPIRRALQGRP